MRSYIYEIDNYPNILSLMRPSFEAKRPALDSRLKIELEREVISNGLMLFSLLGLGVPLGVLE